MIIVQVSASGMHLVSVDVEDVARLKLRPRYDLDANQRVVRLDDAPTYDVPPTVDELLREAARTHEEGRPGRRGRLAVNDQSTSASAQGGGIRSAGVLSMTNTTVSGDYAGATTGAGFTSSRLPHRWHS